LDNINAFFNEEESLNLYRFIQESVNNVIRHSQASTLIFTLLKEEDHINVCVKDNGRGFVNVDKQKFNSLGLKTMMERLGILNGSFDIQSIPGEGTTINATIPI
jgi:signal transduction histidine kinase